MSAVRLGIKISNLQTANILDAVGLIQQHLIMPVDSIKRALEITDFIFWAPTFTSLTLTGWPFTITGVEIEDDTYINISGGRLEVPYAINSLNNVLYKRLNADDYIRFSDISVDAGIQAEIAELIANKFLFKLIPEIYGTGDFSSDFDFAGDFL